MFGNMHTIWITKIWELNILMMFGKSLTGKMWKKDILKQLN